MWFPIPALLQQHPDGARDPQRYRILGFPGSFSLLYLRQHPKVSVLAKGDVACQNPCGDETPEEGEWVTALTS